MKSKQLIRFYFTADSLNKALDNLIMSNACKSADHNKSAEYYADKICTLIGAKNKLGELWRYLDGIMVGLTEEERAVLRFYGMLRTGVKRLSPECVREVRRVTVKFTRHARNAERYAEGIKLVKRYYCLMRTG